MLSKDLSIFFIFIAWQSNFEKALATLLCGPLKFVTVTLALKSLHMPGFHRAFNVSEEGKRE